MIFIGGLHENANVEPVLDKIANAVSTPVDLDGVSITPSISMGVTFAPEHGTDFASLLHHADVAMYQAKTAGRGRYEFYRPAVPVND